MPPRVQAGARASASRGGRSRPSIDDAPCGSGGQTRQLLTTGARNRARVPVSTCHLYAAVMNGLFKAASGSFLKAAPCSFPSLKPGGGYLHDQSKVQTHTSDLMVSPMQVKSFNWVKSKARLFYKNWISDSQYGGTVGFFPGGHLWYCSRKSHAVLKAFSPIFMYICI